MEIANHFGNNELNSDDPENSASPEKDKKKDKRGEKKPIILEGILFDRARDLKESEKSTKAEKAKAESEAELPKPELVEAADQTLVAERELAEEIVQDRAQTVAAEIAAEPAGPEQAVAEADEDLLQEIRERIDTVQAAEPASTEAVKTTIETAYQQAAETIASQPLEAAPEVPPATPIETSPAQPDVIDAALKSMNEAYEHYQAPDYAYNHPPVPAATEVPAVEKMSSSTLPIAETSPVYDTSTHKREALTVGILGYWLGRWRGRKRAERRFAPIKRNLEKTVTELQGEVGNREAQIRDLQRERLQAAALAEVPATETVLTQTAEVPRPAKTNETRPVDHMVGETMTMPLPANPETGAEIIERAPRAEQLTPTQLLQVAEAIKIDGVTVRSMFEVQRFDETSLRRIVNEYLRHGDVSRVVLEEVERHDRFRYARFETLNQAVPGPMISSQPSSADHSSLPRPILPAANMALLKSRHANKKLATTNSNSPAETALTVSSSTTAERLLVALSILFVGIALVLLVAVITSRS